MAKQRHEEESREDLPQVPNDAPPAKFQEQQQVAPSTGFNSNTGSSQFTLEKKKAPGSQLKQDIAATVVRDQHLSGGNAGDGASFAGTRSSGSVGGVVGAANSTPVVGKPNRSDSRTGKKLDRNSTKLNFIPSEQVLVEWDESKPLADAADQDQGFNGTYRNEFARSTKRAENVPGALMFDRSVDMLVKDKLYFGQGQLVKQYGVGYDLDWTKMTGPNANGIYIQRYITDYVGTTFGNYMPVALHIKFDANGKLEYCVYDEVDVTVNGVDEHVANRSSVATRVAVNRAELWRETMDSKAGDEKADIWTCLARADDQPTQILGALEAIEADVGNELLTGYRKSCVAMSFQLNRAHKDGQKLQTPGIFASRGINYNFVSEDAQTTALGDGLNDALFNLSAYCSGSPSTIIAIYDSVAKYNNKADPILQPRGYRMHLQTADNNLDAFYADKDFVSIYDASETFSTIDREYDPTAPVCVTDKCKIIHRISWGRMANFIRNKWIEVVTRSKTSGDNVKKTVILFDDGVARFIKATGNNVYLEVVDEVAGAISASTGKFVAPSNYHFGIGSDGGQATINVTIGSQAPVPGSGNEIITLNNADILNTGIELEFYGSAFGTPTANSSFEVISYPHGGPGCYSYSDLRNNYIVEVKHPLAHGLINYLEDAVGAKYRSLTHGSAVVIPIVHSTMQFSLWSLLLCAATPYINKVRINAMRDVLYYEKNVEYPFKDALVSLAEVKTKAYTNFGFVNYDTELEVKRMNPAAAVTWIFPEMFQQVGFDSSNGYRFVMLPWYSSQNEMSDAGYDDDASAMSFPSIRSGVRLGSLDSLYGMSEKDVRLCLDKVSRFMISDNQFPEYSLAYKYSSVGDGQVIMPILSTDILDPVTLIKQPRELGWVMDAPYGICTPTYNNKYSYGTDIIGTTGYRAYYWLGNNPTTYDSSVGQKILDGISVNVNRAANFDQTWFCILASGTTPSRDHGFALSANQIFTAAGALLAGASSFKPYADQSNDAVTTNVNSMMSLQKALWTRIQKLPFVISPFDLKVIDNTGSPNDVVLVDPFDMLYWFGLGGFRASDYRESVYNREKEVVNQGYLFVRDPWVIASPLFKEGQAVGGVTVTKGFELR